MFKNKLVILICIINGSFSLDAVMGAYRLVQGAQQLASLRHGARLGVATGRYQRPITTAQQEARKAMYPYDLSAIFAKAIERPLPDKHMWQEDVQYVKDVYAQQQRNTFMFKFKSAFKFLCLRLLLSSANYHTVTEARKLI